MKMLLAKKLGMTTIYEGDVANNVTLLEAEGNEVVGVRTQEKDGYNAIQVGMDKNVVNEFRVDDIKDYEKGKKLEVSQFEKDEKVNVQGIIKGKGFQGVVKRHGFAGSPASHGHRHDLRAPGSIGSAFPERVMKGKRMAGRMGGHNATSENLKVVHIDNEKNIIAVKGSVPGTNGTVVRVFSR